MEAGEALTGTRSARARSGVTAVVESVRPAWLWAGATQPIVIRGWAFHARLGTFAVHVDVGATTLDPIAIGIERDDVYDRYVDTPQRSAHARRSGYTAAGLAHPTTGCPGAPTKVTITLDTGTRATTADRVIPVRDFPQVPLTVTGSPEVAIAMATFNPRLDLFTTQIESIRAQTHRDWCCIVCDDASDDSNRAEIRRILADDPRFVLVENDERAGFYGNFERALTVVPLDTPFVALADQDDRWRPDKLARLLRHLQGDDEVQLVASDTRLVDATGGVLADTFYAHRQPTHDDPYSLFVVNSLIGASMMFRRHLLAVALPFPRAFDDVYHDHWLTRVALARGRVAFEPEALYDYVQHGTNVLGSRRAMRWPMREMVKPYVRSLLGSNDRRLPPDWEHHFMTNVLEPQLAAHLVRARWPPATHLGWMDRIAARSSAREIVRVLRDHRREARGDRMRREAVELALFAGRAWSLQHQPPARALSE